uniref:Glutaredoxin-2, mitochondrial n=1 Tax=Panagrolaimus superbus TaxID=310955 RepID=A0A914Z7H9_9BILA
MIPLVNYLGYRNRMLKVSFLKLIRSASGGRNGGSSNTSQTMSAAKSFVDEAIAKNKVAVFSKSYCPYCTKAKDALDSFKIPSDKYYCVELDKREDCDDIQNYLQSITGGRSVPRVFINGEFFGGGDDTAAAKKNGKLEKKLSEVGAI